MSYSSEALFKLAFCISLTQIRKVLFFSISSTIVKFFSRSLNIWLLDFVEKKLLSLMPFIEISSISVRLSFASWTKSDSISEFVLIFAVNFVLYSNISLLIKPFIIFSLNFLEVILGIEFLISSIITNAYSFSYSNKLMSLTSLNFSSKILFTRSWLIFSCRIGFY